MYSEACNFMSHTRWLPMGQRAENKFPHREDRYTWRHNNVLLAIAKAVQERISEANSKAKPKEVKQFSPLQSNFILPGQALDSEKKVIKKDAPHLLQVANDWKCDFDLPEFRPPGSCA